MQRRPESLADWITELSNNLSWLISALSRLQDYPGGVVINAERLRRLIDDLLRQARAREVELEAESQGGGNQREEEDEEFIW